MTVLTPGSVHPQYNAQTRANDIGMLRLTNPIVPSADLHPVLLPPAATEQMSLPLENEEGNFVGFGYTALNSGASQFLKRAHQRVTSNAICTAFFIVNTQNSFCALDNVEFANGCNGDVGNPYVVQYRRENMLVGVLSMHPQCKLIFEILQIFVTLMNFIFSGGMHSPTAYTRVAFYRQWIDQQLAV